MTLDSIAFPVVDAATSEIVLELTTVVKRYGTQSVLNGVSFRLRQRNVLALCGISGSGKSTLIRIIAGLLPFEGGEFTISSTTVKAGEPYPSPLYGRIGVIFQDHNLFPHLTAIANVTLGLREAKHQTPRLANERGMAELARMGVDSLAQRYPATLSGGERQRVAIARALAMDPLLLLLDEPTANLDPDRVDEVCDRVVELASDGATMILVTHNLKCARQAADVFAVLQNGRCLVSDDPAILEDVRQRA